MTSKVYGPLYPPWVEDDAKELSRLPLINEGDTAPLESFNMIGWDNLGQNDIWCAHSPSVVNVITRLLTESSLATYRKIPMENSNRLGLVPTVDGSEFSALVEAIDDLRFKQNSAFESQIEALMKLDIGDLPESTVTLAQRFVRKRSRLKSNFTLLKQSKFAEYLDLQDSNTSRALKVMRDKREVLFLETQDGPLYPHFQLNKDLCIYKDLTVWLPQLYESLSGWDIAFWLTEESTIETYNAQLSDSKIDELANSGMDYDDIAAEVETLLREEETSVTFRPLELLKSGNSLFNDFARWKVCGDGIRLKGVVVDE
ncbi:hypothetical protein TUMSATVNIG1_58530 (plasmid) [Vibrio nigripulchritudo]|uniref:hypothetical protein n=1 Tax=Vibrio nigripulchritudo TaxID=28173 RepID=UPI00190BA8F5|nr:hypothetical protein [Vibrio nigripulchritudo]BCL73868.1 hypothetical protein VNTUMSATTG_58050 [Vibrio nigripulchritudo]BDU35244.1 hypothetical protein TUMSATVNIG1_58530 [Vibrio nigripulchritudo]